MRLHSVFVGAAAAVLVQAAGAQSRIERPRSVDRAPRPPRVMVIGGSDTRAVLGITVSTSGSARDTLGLLVNSVVPGGPADRAGISEGNRLAEINGIRLRLYPGDVGQSEAGDMMMRRLTNELRRVRPGDEVTLRVYADGRFRTVTVQTGDAAVVASGRARATPDVSVEVERADHDKLERDKQDKAEREKQEKAEREKAEKLEREKQQKVDAAGGAQPTVEAIVQAMGELQAQVRKLLQEEGPGALRRALDNADQQIHELQRQLREVQAERQRAAEEARLAEEARKAEEARRVEEARATERARLEREADEARSARRDEGDWTGLSGLRVTRISEDLAAYFGEGSERGLLVLEADPSWEPLRAGDIILRVNGARIYSADRLGNQLDPRQENTVEVLRRGRSLTMTVGRRRR